MGGWAVVQLQAGESGYAACTASCSGRVQMDEPCLDALSCELVAVIKALSFSHGKITIWCDSESLLNGISCGHRTCTDSANRHADLWQDLWRRLIDTGPEMVTWKKATGHPDTGAAGGGSGA